MDNDLYVGFSEGSGWLPKLIRIFTGGRVNHAFLCWDDMHLGWVVLGANANGVTLDTWGNFTKSRMVAAIFKPANPAFSLWHGLMALKNDINAKYDAVGLVGMGAVEIARRFFNRNVSNLLDREAKGKVFCSMFTTMVIRKAGIRLLPDQNADTVDPQELMHELVRRSDFVQGSLPTT